MNLSEPFIRRPVMTGLLVTCLLVFGAFSYRLLSVSDLPNVDFPTISVTATLPGASAETMAASVATPLEKQLSAIASIDTMTSTSSQGNTQITIQFALDRDIDAAAADVQAALTSAARLLPDEMTTPPAYHKVNPSDSPIYYLALTSATLPLTTLGEYAETTLAQRLSMVPGVAQLYVLGPRKYAVRVRLDPARLAARGLGIDEVQSAISQQSVNLPTGQLEGRTRVYTIDAKGQLRSAAEFAGLVVAWRDGAPVHLAELGRVEDGIQDERAAAAFNGRPAVIVGIQRQPGANTVQIVDTVRALLPTLEASLPRGARLDTVFDRSHSIRESVRDVQFTLGLSVALVVLVIFLFLRSASATLIPAVALPLSLLGTFPVMYLLGYTIDNLSLMALTLCVGFVVDDAIVMMENVARHVEMGKTRLAAALDGSREIGFTIVSMTISLVAVFLPVLFLGGVIGRLLHEFAVTIMAAVLVSGIVSLTLTPLLCSRMMKSAHEQRPAPGTAWFEHGFQRARRGYERGLDWALDHRPIVLAGFAASFALTVFLFGWMPKGFIPSDDTGQLAGLTEAAQDVSFEEMQRKQAQIAKIVLQNPHVEAVMAVIGIGGSSSTANQGRMVARLKPAGQRPGAAAVLAELRPKLSSVPGMRAFLQMPPTIRMGPGGAKSLYLYTLQGTDTRELYDWAPKLEAALRRMPELSDVSSDLQLKSTRVTLEIDRERAGSLGVSVSQIENALYSAYGQRQVGTIYTATNQYWVLLEVAPEFRDSPAALGALYVRASSGALVPISQVTRAAIGVAPLAVSHTGQVPGVNLSFNLAPGVALSRAVARIEAAERELRMPGTITGSFQGAAQQFRDSLANLGWLLAFAVFVIYIVLGILYESYVHPLTILSGLPTAGLGALLTLAAFGRELDLYAFVGIIMLIGIVKKNAIMMIDFALEAERRHARTPREAIREACLVRFRPIMMTTLAAIHGTLPIALAIGASGNSRQSLGLAVVGGLLVSQFLTLFLTPVVYLGLDGLAKRGRGAVPAADDAAARGAAGA